MIDRDNLIYIGYISRPHSFKREVQLQLDRKIVSVNRDDFLFFKIEGHFIPYKVLSKKGKSDEPVLKLEFIEDRDSAKSLSGTEVYTDQEVLDEESELSFIGFELVDKHLGSIGIIEDVQELPQQLMLVVPYNGDIKYVPLAEDFIDYISAEDKEIWVTLPQGLLDL